MEAYTSTLSLLTDWQTHSSVRIMLLYSIETCPQVPGLFKKKKIVYFLPLKLCTSFHLFVLKYFLYFKFNDVSCLIYNLSILHYMMEQLIICLFKNSYFHSLNIGTLLQGKNWIFGIFCTISNTITMILSEDS